MATHYCNAIRVNTSLSRFLRTLEYIVNVEFLNSQVGNFSISTRSLPNMGNQPVMEVTIIVADDPSLVHMPEQANRIILPYQQGLIVQTKICEPTLPTGTAGHQDCTEAHGGVVSVIQDVAP